MIASAWASIKALGTGQKALIVLAIIAAVFAVIKMAAHFIDQNNQAQRDLGQTRAINDGLTETLDRTEKANDAAETIARDPVAARDNCLRHSRTPENC